MKKIILVIFLGLFASLANANSKEELRKLPSTIRCMYLTLDYMNVNVLYKLYFYREGTTQTYHAELTYFDDIEFNKNEEVLKKWTAILIPKANNKYTLAPTESIYNDYYLEIAKKKVPFVYDPPTEGGFSIYNIGNMPKYNNYDFSCEGGPLTH